MKLLKQKTSGEIYVWTEVLAKRDDMEEYVRPPTIVIPEPTPKVEVAEVEVAAEVKEVTRPTIKKKVK